MWWSKKPDRPETAKLRAFQSKAGAAEEIRAQLVRKLSYKPKTEINFVMTHNSRICCFSGKTLYITDGDLRPVLFYESSAFLHACSISDTAKYAVCQMANSADNDPDSGAMVLFDVTAKTELARSRIPSGWKNMTHLFVDENARRIFVYYADGKVDYDFALHPNADALDRLLRAQRTLPTASPYALNSRAQELITKAKAGEIDWNLAESEVLDILDRIGKNEKMSNYQLSLTYRDLGDCYAARGEAAKAVSAYETGLAYNPALPVKKKLQQEKQKI